MAYNKNYNQGLNPFRSDLDSWWSMTEDYYRLLSSYKKMFSNFYMTNEIENLLNIVELEWIHVQNNFLDEKYKEDFAFIEERIVFVNKLLNKNFNVGSRGDEMKLKINGEVKEVLKSIMKRLYFLEAEKGMLQRKQENNVLSPEEEW